MQECRFAWLLQSHELATEEVHGLLQSAQFGAVILVRGEKTLAVALQRWASCQSTQHFFHSMHWQLEKSSCKPRRISKQHRTNGNSFAEQFSLNEGFTLLW